MALLELNWKRSSDAIFEMNLIRLLNRLLQPRVVSHLFFFCFDNKLCEFGLLLLEMEPAFGTE